MTLFEKALTAIVGGAAAVKGVSLLFDKKKSDENVTPTAGTTETTTTVETTSEVKSEETPTEEKTEQ